MTLSRVFLIVDRSFGNRLHEIASDMAVWIVDSPANHEAIVARGSEKKEASCLTSFRDFPELSCAALATRMVSAIDSHHGMNSQHPAFSWLTIIGTASEPSLCRSLGEIGFTLVAAKVASLEFEMKETSNESTGETAPGGPG